MLLGGSGDQRSHRAPSRDRLAARHPADSGGYRLRLPATRRRVRRSPSRPLIRGPRNTPDDQPRGRTHAGSGTARQSLIYSTLRILLTRLRMMPYRSGWRSRGNLREKIPRRNGAPGFTLNRRQFLGARVAPPQTPPIESGHGDADPAGKLNLSKPIRVEVFAQCHDQEFRTARNSASSGIWQSGSKEAYALGL